MDFAATLTDEELERALDNDCREPACNPCAQMMDELMRRKAACAELQQRTDYDRGTLHASEDVAERGLGHAMKTANSFALLTDFAGIPPPADAYACGYADELLWIASVGIEESNKRDTILGRRLRQYVAVQASRGITVRTPSKLDEICAAGMRSRERGGY